MRRPSLLIPAAAGALLALALAGTATAHVVQRFGSYSLAIGWLHEPTYVGIENAVQVIVKDAAGQPVSDIPVQDLTVTVSAGGRQSPPLPLVASLDPDTGLGTPGEYLASLIPTIPGAYTFHLAGTIHGQVIDRSFTSSDQTFDSAQSDAAAQFPVKLPSVGDLATLLNRVDGRVQAAQAAASQALLVGGVAGGLGVVLGAIGIALALRARRGARG